MKKRCLSILAVLAAVAVIAVAASYVVDEPLRGYLEREVNSRLKGYSLELGKLTVHPLSLSVDLENVSLIQKENPEPPLAKIRLIHGSVYWRDLLSGHIVGDATIDQPRIYLNISNLKSEIGKPPEKKEAWQETIEAITPITVNEFRVNDGEVTYVESVEARTVTLRGLQLAVHNVNNIKSRKNDFPSDISVEGEFLGATVTVDGQADFLRQPHLALKLNFSIQELDLSQFREIAEARRVVIEKGLASATGYVELKPEKKSIILKDLSLRDARINYRYAAETPPAKVKKEEKGKTTEKARKLQSEVVNRPGLLITAKRIRIARSNFGFVNTSAKPQYRAFMDEVDLEIQNFSNHLSEGQAELYLKGRFMGSGETVASGLFRPEERGPDFDFRIAIKDTSMLAMNNIFRAYGKFDVSAGRFSVYSELTVKNNEVTGYVKPLFRDMKVYDRRTDAEKSQFQKLYEGIVGGLAKLLESRSEESVATETPITGPIENPKAGTWATLINIIRNAFFQAILPGFEENIK